jgi:hypothetical protein
MVFDRCEDGEVREVRRMEAGCSYGVTGYQVLRMAVVMAPVV